ncbi:hypothetical protein BJ741DRAFT_235666 [Chytriomyces cf. hyalinus JEL632]|nr:hypothetical protein BJ741DRAFT_235666 [Chytriomyces cf. hyalinus JEL632]
MEQVTGDSDGTEINRNSVAAGQSNTDGGGEKAVVLSLAQLCVQLNALNVLSLQHCDDGSTSQILTFAVSSNPPSAESVPSFTPTSTQASTTTATDSLPNLPTATETIVKAPPSQSYSYIQVEESCLGPAWVHGVSAIAKYAFVYDDSCPLTWASSADSISLLQTRADAVGFLNSPDTITPLMIGNGCITSLRSDPNLPGVVVNACDNSPEQLWYYQFGQIRNLASGLCLDAPGSTADPDDMAIADIVLNPCNGPNVVSQMWQHESDSRVFSLQSYNCIRNVMGMLKLGNNQCGKFGAADALDLRPRIVYGAASFLPTIPFACASTSQRMEYRDLNEAQKKEFWTGLSEMRKCPSLLGRKNLFDDYAAFYGAIAKWHKNRAMFLPWISYFLNQFESDMRVLTSNAGFAMPYWAWDANPNDWFHASNGIFTSDGFGTFWDGGKESEHASEQALAKLCIPDGYPENWQSHDYPCLRRISPTSQNTSESVNPKNARIQFSEHLLLTAMHINPVTNKRYESYDAGRWVLEYAARQAQAATGGWLFDPSDPEIFSTGQLLSDASAGADPLFYLHLANVDRYFRVFQKINAGQMYDGEHQYPARDDGVTTRRVPATMNDVLPGFNVAVADAWSLGHGAMCYSYAAYSKSILSVQIAAADVAAAGKWADPDDENADMDKLEEFIAARNSLGKESKEAVVSKGPQKVDKGKIGLDFPGEEALHLHMSANNLQHVGDHIAATYRAFESLHFHNVKMLTECLKNLGIAMDDLTMKDYAVISACATYRFLSALPEES